MTNAQMILLVLAIAGAIFAIVRVSHTRGQQSVQPQPGPATSAAPPTAAPGVPAPTAPAPAVPAPPVAAPAPVEPPPVIVVAPASPAPVTPPPAPAPEGASLTQYALMHGVNVFELNELTRFAANLMGAHLSFADVIAAYRASQASQAPAPPVAAPAPQLGVDVPLSGPVPFSSLNDEELWYYNAHPWFASHTKDIFGGFFSELSAKLAHFKDIQAGYVSGSRGLSNRLVTYSQQVGFF